MVAPRNVRDAKNFPHARVELVDTCHALRASRSIATRLLNVRRKSMTQARNLFDYLNTR
jgi:hypothetical protein